jgi:hypothetical protein
MAPCLTHSQKTNTLAYCVPLLLMLDNVSPEGQEPACPQQEVTTG